MDKRDEQTWVTLELTRTGEKKAQDGSLAQHLLKDLGAQEDFPIFIPYVIGGNHGKSLSILMEGYAFVGSGLPETRYFRLEGGPIVQQVLSAKGPHGMRVLHTIPGDRIETMRKQLRLLANADVEIGMAVRVLAGFYTGLEGTVVDVFPETVAVQFPLRSLNVIHLVKKEHLSSDLTEVCPKDPLPDFGPSKFDSFDDLLERNSFRD